MWNNFSIWKKGLVLICVPLAFQAVFVLLVFQVQQHNRAAAVWSLHSREVLGEAQVVLAGASNVEASSRGYVLTGEGRFLTALEQASRDTATGLKRLESLVADNAKQQAQVRRISQLADNVLDWHEAQCRLAREGNKREAEERLRSLRGMEQMGLLRDAMAEFIAEEERLNDLRQLSLEKSWRLLQAVIIGGAALVFTVSTLLFVAFKRGIHSRFTVLMTNTRRLAARMNDPLPIVGNDEISRVDHAVREMAAELTRSEAQRLKHARILSAVLEGMGEGLIVADRNGRFLLFNPAAERIVGLGASDVAVQQWTSHFGCYLPDQRTPYPVEELPLVRAMRGEALDGAEMFIRNAAHPEGAWISVTARPLADENGSLVGGTIVLSDISERKQIETRLRTMNEDLERRVEQRTAELSQANRDLVQKNQENELFVYSVSHDLRSPLVNLQGYSGEITMLAEEIRGLLDTDEIPAEIRKQVLEMFSGPMESSIRFLCASASRMGDIISALLRLSRAGRVEYRWEAIDLAPVLQRVVDSLAGLAGERGAQVILHELPTVRGDATAVEQVFANLINNALNYLDPLRPGIVEVGALEDGTLYVRDNGRGIPRAYQHKLFQAFQRLHPDDAPGEGIGLTMVKRIVERHGGRIWFESEEGSGTTFFLTLMLANPCDHPGESAHRVSVHV